MSVEDCITKAVASATGAFCAGRLTNIVPFFQFNNVHMC